jgi:hypothetical protein
LACRGARSESQRWIKGYKQRLSKDKVVKNQRMGASHWLQVS